MKRASAAGAPHAPARSDIRGGRCLPDRMNQTRGHISYIIDCHDPKKVYGPLIFQGSCSPQDIFLHSAMECGIYFTASPGYTVYDAQRRCPEPGTLVGIGSDRCLDLPLTTKTIIFVDSY